MTNFPGKEKILFWQERKRLKQEIRRTLLAAMTLARNPKDRVIVEKFIDCIEPGLLCDSARLPYQGNHYGFARSTPKIHCVFALIACLISAYWSFINTEDVTWIASCQDLIDKLKLACNNYEILAVHGDPAKGYWLE